MSAAEITQRLSPFLEPPLISAEPSARPCPFADLRIRDYLTAIRVALECSGFTRREAEARLRHGDPQREGAARLVLAGDAVACVDELWGLGDFIADFAAQAAAGLWQVRVGLRPGRAQAFGCRNVPYCLLAATAAAACSMTRIAAIMGHGPRLTRRTPARARSGISGTPCVTMMLTGRGVS